MPRSRHHRRLPMRSNLAGSALAQYGNLLADWDYSRSVAYLSSSGSGPQATVTNQPVGYLTDLVQYDILQPVESLQPIVDTSLAGGRGGLDFGALSADDYLFANMTGLATALSGTATPYTIGMVVNVTEGQIFSFGNASDPSNNYIQVGLNLANSALVVRHRDNGGGEETRIISISIGSLIVLLIRFSGTQLTVVQNGVTLLNNAAFASGNLVLTDFALGTLYRGRSSAFAARMDWHQGFVFGEALSDATLTAIDSDMRTKWGI